MPWTARPTGPTCGSIRDICAMLSISVGAWRIQILRKASTAALCGDGGARPRA